MNVKEKEHKVWRYGTLVCDLDLLLLLPKLPEISQKNEDCSSGEDMRRDISKL
jgi:hypothetical protein